MSRASHTESRSGREAVFTRPAHLDALVARVESERLSADEDGDDDSPDRYGDRSSRYGDDRASRYGDMPPSRRTSSLLDSARTTSIRRTSQEDCHSHKRNDDAVVQQLEDELEDTRRELEVTTIQNDHLQGQMRGLFTELELHKKHGREFKTMLELTEARI